MIELYIYVLITVLIATIMYKRSKSQNKENFKWMNSTKENNKNCNLHDHNDLASHMACSGNLNCWFPYNYKLPKHNNIPYCGRFNYADRIWKNPSANTYYDNSSNTFIY